MSARGIERSTQIQENIPVTKENAVVGLIVKRGKGWDWGNQDGGEGKKGVILKLDVSPSSEHYWVSVKWDSGNSNSYRCGKGSSQPDPEKYDLYIADVDFIVKNNLKYINYAVGNIVKKGVHWCYPDQNKSGLNGKIERIEKDWALVRWDDGSYEMYRIGHEGKYDIQKVI